MGRNSVLKPAFILLAGALLTAAMTWPFITKLSTYYLDSGDAPLNGWILWHNQKAFLNGDIFHPSRYFQSNQMYPLPDTFTYSENMAVPSLLFAPIYWMTHNLVLSVNLFLFLAFVLSFAASYFALLAFVKNEGAAWIGAAIYTFNPLTFSHFPVDFQYMNKFFLPLVFLYAHRFLTKPETKNAFLFFLFFTLNALSVIYFEIFTLAVLPLFALPWIASNAIKKNYAYFRRFAKCALLFIVFLPALFYFNLPYLRFAREDGVIRHLDEQKFFSAKLMDFAIPNQDSLLYGKLAKSLSHWRAPGEYPEAFHVLFLAFVPLGLAAIGAAALLWRKNQSNGALGFFLALAAGFLFSLGPYYGGLRLPFYYIYKTTPLFDGLRIPSRFEFLMYVPFSLLAAYGTSRLLEAFPKLKKFIVSALMAAVLLESYPIRKYSDESSVLSLFRNGNSYPFLKNKISFHLPTYYEKNFNVGYIREASYLTWSTQTGETLVNGYSGYMPGDWINFILRVKLLDGEALNELSALGVNEVVIHKKFYDGKLTFPKSAVSFEDKNILVIDPGRIPEKIKRCGSRNLQVKVSDFEALNGEPAYFYATAANDADCYLTNEGNLRHDQINLAAGGEKFTGYLSLPPVLRPHEIVSLTGTVRPIKTQVTHLPAEGFEQLR